MSRITLTNDGAWTWFNDPRAIYVDGRVVAGWVNRRGDIQLGSHELGGGGRTSVVTLHPAFQADDHVNPGLLKHPDGTIAAFYAAHGGRDVHAVTVAPTNAGGWRAGEVTTIPRHPHDPPGEWGWSYANPFHLSRDGSIVVGSRGPNFNPVFRVLRDGAWGPATNFVLNPSRRPYAKYHSDGVDRIGFAFTDAHPLGGHNNIYYAYLDRGTFRRADGTMIKDASDGPLTLDDARSAILFDHSAHPARTGDNSWVWDVAADPATGHPIVALVTFPSTAMHQYHVARWDGTRWIDRILIDNAGGKITTGDDDEHHYSGGLALDPVDPNLVYVSHQTGERQWDLEQWRTHDGGASWTRRTIASAPGEKNIRPYVPRDRPRDVKMVLWLSGQYGYWDFSRSDGYATNVKLWTSRD